MLSKEEIQLRIAKYEYQLDYWSNLEPDHITTYRLLAKIKELKEVIKGE